MQVYSNHQDDKRTIALVRNTNSILNGLSRSLNPLHVLTADISLTADWSTGALKEHFDSFDRILRGPTFSDIRTFGISSLPNPVCEPDATSETCEKELIIYEVFCPVQVILFFYKDPIDPDTLNFGGRRESCEEDLRVSFDNPCAWTRALAEAPRQLEGASVGSPPLAQVALKYDSWDGQLRWLDFQIK